MIALEMIASLVFLVCLMYLTGLILWVISILAISLCYYVWPIKSVVVYYKNNETGKVSKIKMSEKLADQLWGENGKS